MPGGGGHRLAVPDLIKEILTGSGESEKQVGDLASQAVTHCLCLQGRTELSSAENKTDRRNSMVRLRISQFEGGCLSLSSEKQTEEKTIDNSDN